MKRFYLMQSSPGCGKSTIADLLQKGIRENCHYEDIVELLSTDYYFTDSDGNYNFDPSKLSEYHDRTYKDVCKCFEREYEHVILDNTNIKLAHVQKYIDAAKEHGYTIQTIRVTAPFEEAFTRNVHGVPKHRAKRMYMEMEDLMNPEMNGARVPLNPNRDPLIEGLSTAVLCDLDGTLALMGDRSPYDASKCDVLDSINRPVAETLSALSRSDIKIVFMSGREEKDRDPTTRFILNAAKEYEFEWETLLMRETDDHRKDSIAKLELYNKYVKPNWNILYCLDDRSQVVDTWRGLGIPCWQVNVGDF